MKYFVPSEYAEQKQIAGSIAVPQDNKHSFEFHRNNKFQIILQQFSAEKSCIKKYTKTSSKNLKLLNKMFQFKSNKVKLPSLPDNHSIQQQSELFCDDGSFIHSINDEMSNGNPNDFHFSRNMSFLQPDEIQVSQQQIEIASDHVIEIDIPNVNTQVEKVWKNHCFTQQALQIDMPAKQKSKFYKNHHIPGFERIETQELSQKCKTEQDSPQLSTSILANSSPKQNLGKSAFQLYSIHKMRPKVHENFKFLQELETKDYLSNLSKYLSTIYHKPKGVPLNKFEFTKEQVFNYLKCRYSANLINKIFIFFGFVKYFDIKTYLSVIKKLQYFELNDILFLSFHLLDENNDGFICLNDLFELLKMKDNYLAQQEFHDLEKMLWNSFEKFKAGEIDNSHITYKEIYKFQDIAYKDYYRASHSVMNKKFSIKKNTTALISSFNPYTFVIDDSKRILRKTPHELNEKYSNLFGNIDKCKINFEIYKNFFGVHYKPYLLKDVLAYVCCLFHKNVEYGYTQDELINGSVNNEKN